MLLCGMCNTPLNEGSQFCSKCGVKVSNKNKVCGKCGHLLDSNVKYCGFCGALFSVTEKTTETFGSVNQNSSYFVQAKCENCGANLTIDHTKSTVYCSSCGTPYVIPSKASTPTNDNKSPEFVIEGGELKAYKGSSADVVIPAGVTYIGEGVFQSMGITRVSLPDSLVYIKNNAFKYCYMLQEIKLPSAMDGIEYDAFYGDSNLRVIWPDSWIERKESKLKVVAQMHKRELYFLTADATKIKKGQSFTMFYCGHGSENPFYYFCESSEFFKNNRSNNSIFQYFYDVESLNRDDMYSDLVELFDKAAIDRNEISTVDVPFYGWKSRNETPDAVKNGKIQLFSIQVTIEYGWNDYENPVNITL